MWMTDEELNEPTRGFLSLLQPYMANPGHSGPEAANPPHHGACRHPIPPGPKTTTAADVPDSNNDELREALELRPGRPGRRPPGGSRARASRRSSLAATRAVVCGSGAPDRPLPGTAPHAEHGPTVPEDDCVLRRSTAPWRRPFPDDEVQRGDRQAGHRPARPRGYAAWAGFVTDQVLPATRSGGLDAPGRFGRHGASRSRPRWTRGRTVRLCTGHADRAQLVVLARQYWLAALPARDDEITSSTRARQSSR